MACPLVRPGWASEKGVDQQQGGAERLNRQISRVRVQCATRVLWSKCETSWRCGDLNPGLTSVRGNISPIVLAGHTPRSSIMTGPFGAQRCAPLRIMSQPRADQTRIKICALNMSAGPSTVDQPGLYCVADHARTKCHATATPTLGPAPPRLAQEVPIPSAITSARPISWIGRFRKRGNPVNIECAANLKDLHEWRIRATPRPIWLFSSVRAS